MSDLRQGWVDADGDIWFEDEHGMMRADGKGRTTRPDLTDHGGLTATFTVDITTQAGRNVICVGGHPRGSWTKTVTGGGNVFLTAHCDEHGEVGGALGVVGARAAFAAHWRSHIPLELTFAGMAAASERGIVGDAGEPGAEPSLTAAQVENVNRALRYLGEAMTALRWAQLPSPNPSSTRHPWVSQLSDGERLVGEASNALIEGLERHS